ncbi:MAG: 4-hydroxythreonine-4-phosphate dehydrogenase PdxA [Flavobacteriaceae bacterium]|nr:4-hydroxythreonine-4-phosphate dehydrogenase PdxA [Flavobacteriaceae bacterium]
MSKTKPIIGISTGDPNGIGVEVILKCFSDNRMFDFMTPVVFSNYELVKAQAVHFNLKVGLNNLSDFKNLKPNSLNIYEASKGKFNLDFGKSKESGGQLSRESLTTASSFLKIKKIDALVTAPINKKNILHESFDFMGHTDFLNKTFDGEAMMFMVSQDLKIALLTEHIPIDKITENISKDLIEKKIKTIDISMKKDFGIQRPKIAILSINPHAGDDGIIGNQDQEMLIPTMKELSESYLIFGPFPSDSFFGSDLYKKYDAILAIYHDQGLIPFKTITFGNGVNFTAGLDIVRTSPDHGTGYDISGKNLADPSSLIESFHTALSILKNRKQFEEMNSNPLKVKELKSVKK